MSVLEGKSLYLGGPIEFGKDKSWRPEVKKVLNDEFKLSVFDPFADPKQQWEPAIAAAREKKDLQTMRTIARKFVKKDLDKVCESKIMVSYLPFNVPTTGTHHEIIYSNDHKKPTLIVCPQGVEKIPVWYFGFIPLDFMFGSFESLYEYLREVEDGMHQDNERWAGVYGLI